MGQERYLAGRRMRFTSWTPYRAGWDHDHCDFCSTEISDDRTGHAEYDEAWVTSDDSYKWVCPNCFDDFRERFKWVVIEP